MTFCFMMDCLVFCKAVVLLFCHMIDGINEGLNCVLFEREIKKNRLGALHCTDRQTEL